ncbi:S1/P1 Nuclease [Croceicoccus naphthovorans]|uniref:S1/P1 Nuclease n=1 Tax=Croceicoccus naphthovorans TaxID=1348774 RepID=A0A0G3XMC4_9SPHN|nr:S1/P1 Nuclease [Croceicoccus naphthovorans]
MLKIVAAVAVLATSPAHAWGPTGHRIVGQIAADNISGKTQAEIAMILPKGETLAEVSTWPDEQRSDPDEYWQKTATPWHWVTVPPGKTWAEVGAPPEGDAMSALTAFTKTLRDPAASQEDRALALRFIVHIVGDLHQPLHNGRGDDRGGNNFKVEWFGKATNLHSVWDRELLAGNELSFTEYTDRLEAHLKPEQTIAWWTADPKVWMAESIALRDRIYPEEQGAQLGYSYQWTWRPAAEQRLTQAGVRLAAYLDMVFGE